MSRKEVGIVTRSMHDVPSTSPSSNYQGMTMQLKNNPKISEELTRMSCAENQIPDG